MAFIDLDGFKEVNDRFGHQVGDLLLMEIGRRINRVVRASDSAARFGGDEFVVLVQDERASGMRRLAERLSAALREPFSVMGSDVMVTGSVGLAFPGRRNSVQRVRKASGSTWLLSGSLSHALVNCGTCQG